MRLVYSPIKSFLSSWVIIFPNGSAIIISKLSIVSATKTILNTPLVGLGYIFKFTAKLLSASVILLEIFVLNKLVVEYVELLTRLTFMG